jgi:hypothetical protein
MEVILFGATGMSDFFVGRAMIAVAAHGAR